MTQENLRTWKFFIAGLQYHNSGDCIDEMEKGDYLNLIQEPTNKYDANAVRIEYCVLEGDGTKDVMLGYVPKKISAVIAATIFTSDLTCEVILLDKQAKAWERIRVEIKEVKEDG